MNKWYKCVLLIFTCLLIGCNRNNDIDKFKSEYESLNDSNKVIVNINSNDAITYKTSLEIADILETGTGIIYFGFPKCPWCRNIIPVLLDTAKENNVKVYYLNTLELRGTDDLGYKRIMEILDEYLLKNDDGEKVLYVPDVYFVKDGEIVAHHLGSVESQIDASIKLTSDQSNELKGIYQEYIEEIK